MKIVINSCFGGFGLSKAAYEKLIEWGIPVRKYGDPVAEGELVIYDRELTPEGTDDFSDLYWKFKSVSERYWDTWTDGSRADPLIVRLVEELGGGHRQGASGPHAELRIVEIPDGTDYEIEEYDGREHIAERHRTWA